MKENSIDIIIDKKNIFMAKAENDITKDIRLDIITVFLRKGRPIINHYKGIDIC